ncbi:MAG: FAD-dependent oxidoreductase [Pseudomonadota bacterium]
MAGKLAIVGSGPSGCYLAQALRKLSRDAEITIIDRLPVPYGLVRYGVAADHQGTKSISRQFARLFEKQDVAFLGNLEIGRDLDLAELRSVMDAVVLATGLYADRTFGVPGAGLPGIYGAGEITRYWNGHPDAVDLAPELGARVAVFGNGNVAVDLIRLLAKGAEDLDGSDFEAGHVNDAVREIHVIGRSPLERAKFDAAMIRELGQLDHVAFQLATGDVLSASDDPIVAALNALFERDVSMPTKQVIFHSGFQVDRFTENNGRLGGVLLTRDDADRSLDLDGAITAIGFTADTSERAVLHDAAKDLSEGVLAPDLFAAGWFKRGPTGTIADNRADSITVAGHVVERLNAAGSKRPGRNALIERFDKKLTDYQDWLAIDAAETHDAPAGRCRAKKPSYAALFETIENRRQTACK